jgi:hypothetical protein
MKFCKLSSFSLDVAELALSGRAEKRVIFAGYMQVCRYVKGKKHGDFLLRFSPYNITNHNETNAEE